METKKLTPNGVEEEEGEETAQKVSKRGKDVEKKKNKKKKKKKKNKKEEPVEEIISEVRESSDHEESDSEEADFWMPPVGERWDFDDGGEDRWGSASESEHESDGDDETGKIHTHYELRVSKFCMLCFVST